MDKDCHERESPWSRRESGIGTSASNSPISPRYTSHDRHTTHSPDLHGVQSLRLSDLHIASSPDHSPAGSGGRTTFFCEDDNLLFEDSGSCCPSIAEDSEEDYEEEDNPEEYEPRSLSPSSTGPTRPIAIPQTNRQESVNTQYVPKHDNPRPKAKPQSQTLDKSESGQRPVTGSGSLSLSPVVESLVLRGIRSRLSGSFEERSLRISGHIASGVSPGTNTQRGARARPASICYGEVPPADEEEDFAPRARVRTNSAPVESESILRVRRRSVGSHLRSFGDQFNEMYNVRRASNNYPNNYGNRHSLRRQVVSYPGSAKLNFVNAFLGKLP